MLNEPVNKGKMIWIPFSYIEAQRFLGEMRKQRLHMIDSGCQEFYYRLKTLTEEYKRNMIEKKNDN